MRILGGLLVLVILSLLGCSQEPEGLPPSVHLQTAKASLQNLSETGELSGSVVSLLEAAGFIKAVDPQKGKDLEEGVKELSSLTSKDAIKKKARELAEKL